MFAVCEMELILIPPLPADSKPMVITCTGRNRHANTQQIPRWAKTSFATATADIPFAQPE
jgi:hypothetical protein